MDQSEHASMLILVVDDEALFRLHAVDLLEGAGYRVMEAENAASALAMFERHPEIGLLLTDIQMPGRDDGLVLAEKVHARWPHVLLLVTSGGLRLRDEDLPDDGRFLPKPYQERDILSEVSDLIAKGHAA